MKKRVFTKSIVVLIQGGGCLGTCFQCGIPRRHCQDAQISQLCLCCNSTYLTAKGYTSYTCTDEGCDAAYVGDWTEMSEHIEEEEWIVDKEATAEYAGSRHKVCTECGKSVKTEIIKKLPSTESTCKPAEKDTPPLPPPPQTLTITAPVKRADAVARSPLAVHWQLRWCSA